MSIVFFRTIIFYLVVIMALRMMGKRQLGELSPAELVVTIMISDLAAIPMQDLNSPVLNGILPILTLVALEIILSALELRSPRLRRILSGQACIIIDNGKILQQALRKTRLTIQELTEELRQQGFADISTVKYAILESSGKLSALADPAHAPPTARDLQVTPSTLGLPLLLISDGVLVPENIAARGVDQKWVEDRLRENGLTLSEVFLMTADESLKLFWARKEAV